MNNSTVQCKLLITSCNLSMTSLRVLNILFLNPRFRISAQTCSRGKFLSPNSWNFIFQLLTVGLSLATSLVWRYCTDIFRQSFYYPTYKKERTCHSFLKPIPPPISPVLSPYHSASSPLHYSDESLLRVLEGARREVDWFSLDFLGPDWLWLHQLG